MEKQNLYIFSFSKFLLKITLILGITGYCFSYVFEELIIYKSQINGAYKINRILKFSNKNEISIFGSSRAEGNFVPSIISKGNCFNYGISGTQANIWLFFLEEELKKNKSSRIIVNFDLTGLGSMDGNIGNYIPNYGAIKHVLKQKGEFYYHVPFIKYFGQYERYLKFYLNEKMNLTKVTDNGGSFEKNILTKEKFDKLISKRNISKSEFTIDKRLLNKFNTLLNSTEREIILVVSPYHESFFNQFVNVKEANEFLDSIAKRKNVRLIDLRDYIKDETLFLNTTHLNYDGAVKFSKRLKELLS